MNDLILNRLKEIEQLQNKIELKELDYKAKSRKNYNFSKIRLVVVIIFLRNIHTQEFKQWKMLTKNKVGYSKN